MWMLTGIYSTLFIVFAFLGYTSVSEMSRERVLTLNMLEHSYISESNGKYSIYYACKGNVFAKYDIDANRTSSLPRLEDVEGMMIQVPSVGAGHFVDIARAFAGGVAGAWTIKDVGKNLKNPRDLRNVIRYAAAAVSGYSIGVAAAQLEQPSCDGRDSIMHASLMMPLMERIYWTLLNSFNGLEIEIGSPDLHERVFSKDFKNQMESLPEEVKILFTKEGNLSEFESKYILNFWSFGFPLILFTVSTLIFGISLGRLF